MTSARRPRPPAERPGLQGERTELAWERSALGLLAAAGLLLFRHVGPAVGRVVLVAADVGLALLLIWYGRRRGRRIRALRTRPDGGGTVPAAARELYGATAAATAIALGTALVILLGT
ncbi:DUF202 domain-containing protein [Pseudonocardia sp. RS010]|uniref:DUF202 domain-containing protein n=1 Tax=Pseudonocardia sp. RS010 TaxID=3385979 RepID=UPI0039A20770